MTKNELISECLKMPETFMDYPFDATTAVIKLKKNGKMFAFLDYVSPEKIKKNCGQDAPVSDNDLFLNLKCEPALCMFLREKYKAVLPGYYCNKNYWNTIIVDKDVPLDELRKMIQLSFELVSSVKKK